MNTDEHGQAEMVAQAVWNLVIGTWFLFVIWCL